MSDLPKSIQQKGPSAEVSVPVKILARVLRCGHTYCKPCLAQRLSEGRIVCPVCGVPSVFPRRYDLDRSLRTLVVNYTLLELTGGKWEGRLLGEETRKEDRDEFYVLNGVPRQVS